MQCSTTTFGAHALQRMFARGIGHDQVLKVISDHEVIMSYVDDQPFPSHLILGWVGSMPLHVVIAQDV